MSTPTAMDLLAAELVKAAGPQLVQYLQEHMGAAGNELLTVPQIAKELRLGATRVRSLINAGTIRRAKDICEMRVSRRELERYTSGK